jgi:hypothetical protein
MRRSDQISNFGQETSEMLASTEKLLMLHCCQPALLSWIVVHHQQQQQQWWWPGGWLHLAGTYLHTGCEGH